MCIAQHRIAKTTKWFSSKWFSSIKQMQILNWFWFAFVMLTLQLFFVTHSQTLYCFVSFPSIQSWNGFFNLSKVESIFITKSNNSNWNCHLICLTRRIPLWLWLYLFFFITFIYSFFIIYYLTLTCLIRRWNNQEFWMMLMIKINFWQNWMSLVNHHFFKFNSIVLWY